MTHEEIRKKLGFEPWPQWAAKQLLVNETFQAQGAPFIEWPRQIGRTTRMLVDACQAVSEGKSVCVRAHSAAASKLYSERLQEMLYTLGLNPRMVKAKPERVDVCYLDHATLESLSHRRLNWKDLPE